MMKTRKCILKRSLSLMLTLMLCMTMFCSVAMASDSNQAVVQQFKVPIQSLTSGAPLPAVQTAFATAFGEYVTVNVNEDGSKTAVIKNSHMVINLMGNAYDANVATILDANVDLEGTQSATILSTKEEVYTQGMGGGQAQITVPDEFTIPLNLDANGSQKLSITVDFMDAFLGGGNPYPTTVTLTLDMDAAEENLAFKDADYSAVDQAIASIPSDLSPYTDASVKKVQDAVDTVERGLKADRQNDVNAMAAAITSAVADLELKKVETPDTEKPDTNKPDTNKPSTEKPSTDKADQPTDEKIDINRLKDGTYEIPVALWHATQDKASMAASSLNGTARILVKNGTMTVYIYTKPMSFGTITASLQEMKVQQAKQSWTNAVVEKKSADGNPILFSFKLDKLTPYVNVKVNPRVEMMGNQDLDARLKFDVNGIKKISEESQEKPMTPPAENNQGSPQTGDASVQMTWSVWMLVALCGCAAVVLRKKHEN